MTLAKRLALTAAEAAALSILISLNLRWIAKARRSVRSFARSQEEIRTKLAVIIGGKSSG